MGKALRRTIVANACERRVRGGRSSSDKQEQCSGDNVGPPHVRARLFLPSTFRKNKTGYCGPYMRVSFARTLTDVLIFAIRILSSAKRFALHDDLTAMYLQALDVLR